MSVKNALAAEANESDDQDRSFEYNGHTYVVSHPDTWTIEVLEAYEEGKVVTVVRKILGEDQYNEFKKREKPLAKDLQEFIQAMFAESGVDVGE